MLRFSIVAAFCKNSRGIGYKNNLPWLAQKVKIPEDIEHFHKLTTTTTDPSKMNAVVMGHHTYLSLPNKICPLPGRYNIVISSQNLQYHGDAHRYTTGAPDLDVEYALWSDLVDKQEQIERYFVIGGESVYKEAITYDDCEKIYTTEVEREFPADRFFPEIPKYFQVVDQNRIYSKTAECWLNFKVYHNTLIFPGDSEEYNYLNCLRDVLKHGEPIKDRTGVGTVSLFDKEMWFSIPMLPDGSYRIPALTTKKMFLKGVIWELLWFLRGGTNAKWLQERGVKIWDGNTSREFLDKRGLDYPEGEIGPGYGHQWVNWGGSYPSNGVGEVKGINQVKYVIDELRRDPTSRRALISAWNVSDLPRMALPPCHLMYLFKITDHDGEPKLNCKMIMRSNDLFLGSPFNILSTSILTILISKVLGIKTGKISISINDAHIYSNHIEQVKEQLTRIPRGFPRLIINKEISSWEEMVELTFDDFQIIDYYPHPAITAPMAV